MRNMQQNQATPSSWLQRLIISITSLLIIAAGLVLASALFMLLLVVGSAVGAWLWWKLRRRQRAAREIIEGEYRVLEVTPLLTDMRRATTHPSATDTGPQ